MRRLGIIYVIFLSLQVFCQLDGEANWLYRITKIEVDKKYKLQDKLVVNGIEFNYSRFYPEKRFTEYGNVTNDNVATGNWLYLNNKGAMFLKGVAKNGYKIGTWDVVQVNRQQAYKYQLAADSIQTVFVFESKRKHKERKLK